MKKIVPIVLTFPILILTNCAGAETAPAVNAPLPTETMTPTSTSEPLTLGAGFRFSTYGIRTNPGPDYWLSVGQHAKTYLSFKAETDDPNIVSGYVDMNDQTLNAFDANGFKVWLQVEPVNADMLTLIDLVLNQYKHH